jgi:hypothetical protein
MAGCGEFSRRIKKMLAKCWQTLARPHSEPMMMGLTPIDPEELDRAIARLENPKT